MDDYAGTGRTNTFRVKDAAAFAAFCERFELNEFARDAGVGFVCDGDHGEPAIEVLVEDEGDEAYYEKRNWILELADILDDATTCVFMHAGYGEEAGMIGYAVEVAASVGEVRRVDLADIYDGREREEVSRA